VQAFRLGRASPTEYGVNDVIGLPQRRLKVIHEGDLEVFELFCQTLPTRQYGLWDSMGSGKRGVEGTRNKE